VGGDKLPYDDDSGSPATSLLETKLILNSTISDARRGARFLSADLKDHFLASPMRDPEYMKIKYKYFPEDIRTKYELWNLVTADGYFYIRIKKGMYGLKQAALLASLRQARTAILFHNGETWIAVPSPPGSGLERDPSPSSYFPS
jgi:hypothetical protein